MASFNKVILVGNLTRDLELRYTNSGTAICRLGLAVSRRYTTAQGEAREDVCFIDVDVWGKQAENCQRYLRKGSPILVEGQLQFDQWDDRETGQKRSKHLIRAERIQFLSSPRDNNSAPQQAQGGRHQQQSPQGNYGAAPQQQQYPQMQQQGNYSAPMQPNKTASTPPQPESKPMPPFESVNNSDDDIPF